MVFLVWTMYYIVFILPLDVLTLGWGFGTQCETRHKNVWGETAPIKFFRKHWNKAIIDNFEESDVNFNYIMVTYPVDEGEDDRFLGATETLKNHITTVVKDENTL